MIITHPIVNSTKFILATFILPQLSFILLYGMVGVQTACSILACIGVVTFVLMYLRERMAFFNHMVGRAVLSLCAIAAAVTSNEHYVMAWLTVYALVMMVLSLSVNSAERMLSKHYSPEEFYVTPKGSKLFQYLNALIFLGLFAIAEVARRNLSMDAWIYFQVIVPSLFVWVGSLVSVVFLRQHITVNGERVDHYIMRYLEKSRRK